jgi:hypothetical protein
MELRGKKDQDIYEKLRYHIYHIERLRANYNADDLIYIGSELNLTPYTNISPISNRKKNLFINKKLNPFDKFNYMQSYLDDDFYVYSDIEKILSKLDNKDITIFGDVQNCNNIRSSDEALKELTKMMKNVIENLRKHSSLPKYYIAGSTVFRALDKSLEYNDDVVPITIFVENYSHEKFLKDINATNIDVGISFSCGFYNGKTLIIYSIYKNLITSNYSINDQVLLFGIPTLFGYFDGKDFQITLKQYVAIRTKTIYEYRWYVNKCNIENIICGIDYASRNGYSVYLLKEHVEYQIDKKSSCNIYEMKTFENEYFKNDISCVLPSFSNDELTDMKEIYGCIKDYMENSN